MRAKQWVVWAVWQRLSCAEQIPPPYVRADESARTLNGLSEWHPREMNGIHHHWAAGQRVESSLLLTLAGGWRESPTFAHALTELLALLRVHVSAALFHALFNPTAGPGATRTVVSKPPQEDPTHPPNSQPFHKPHQSPPEKPPHH